MLLIAARCARLGPATRPTLAASKAALKAMMRVPSRFDATPVAIKTSWRMAWLGGGRVAPRLVVCSESLAALNRARALMVGVRTIVIDVRNVYVGRACRSENCAKRNDACSIPILCTTRRHQSLLENGVAGRWVGAPRRVVCAKSLAALERTRALTMGRVTRVIDERSASVWRAKRYRPN